MSLKPIQGVENMQPEAIELLEAAGYMDAQTIFDSKVSEITSELVKANNVLEIIDIDPDQATVIHWLKPIEDKFGKSISGQVSTSEIDPAILIEPKDLLNKPFAIPISDQFIKEHHIDLSKIPSGVVRYTSEEQALHFSTSNENTPVNYNIVSDLPQNEEEKTQKPELFDDSVFTEKDSTILDKKRILKMETFHKEGGRVEPIKRAEDINLTKTTKKETNAGVDPNSRFYIKGVLHKSVNRFNSGTYAFIFANILIFLSFAITSLVLIDREQFWWAVWAPTLGFIGLLIYFTMTQKASCPICNQKQYAIKNCLKHRNAHHWPIFGYMLPTALHAIIFKWFRCIFCGTSVRLKE